MNIIKERHQEIVVKTFLKRWIGVDCGLVGKIGYTNLVRGVSSAKNSESSLLGLCVPGTLTLSQALLRTATSKSLTF